MGLLGLFKKKPAAAGAPLALGPLDDELLRRLGNIAAANAWVRGGQDPERLFLATNLDAEQKVDANRPTMRFRFAAKRVGADGWQLAAGIDDPTAFCRFSMELALPDLPVLDPASVDMNHLPGFPLRFSKPADHERSPLARSAFLLAWRVDGGMDSPSLDGPLAVDVTVAGVELTRLDYAYVPTKQPGQHWALLKCHRGEQSFWLGLELATGEGEVFPRRGEVESYTLALDVLRTFT